MKKLHLFIIKSYIGPFILTFFISTFLLLMQFLWKYIDDLVGKGFDFVVILELLVYASASLVPLALPLAILLSSIMTMGNLAENNELMALKSSGISLMRILQPLIIFITLVSIGAFFFSNHVMPYSNLKMSTLLYDVRKQKPEVSIKPGIFSDALEGYSIKVSSKSNTSNMLYDIMIYDHTENEGNRVVTLADSATMVQTQDNMYMVLTLYSGMTYQEIKEEKKRRDQKEYPHRKDKFEEQKILIDISGLGFERSNESLFKNGFRMLNLNQLTYVIDSLQVKDEKLQAVFSKSLRKSNYFKRVRSEIRDSVWYAMDSIAVQTMSIDSVFETLGYRKQKSAIEHARNYARSTQSYVSSKKTEFVSKRKWLKRHEIEWHRKFTLSFSCLLLFFIGAPLGAIIRKGGLGMPVVVAVLFFVIYYVVTMSGEKAAKVGSWSPAMGMWLSAIAFLPIGLFLTYKAAKDSVILNIETYLIPIKKFFNFRSKLKRAAKLKIEKNRIQKNQQ